MYSSYATHGEFDLTVTQEHWWQYGFDCAKNCEKIEFSRMPQRFRSYAKCGYKECQLQQEQLDALEYSFAL
jgi:hypothetical protein